MTEEPHETGEPADDGDPAVRGDRFSGGPARGFLSSLDADERIFETDLAVDRAHVVMLAEQGIIAENDAGAILDALAEVEEVGHGALPEGEDVHEAIESAVIERVGPAGGRMHTARSRNDEVATCIRYRLREDLLAAAEATLVLREALAEAASEHTETVMPGYTHLQPAQPTTVAHFLLSYEQAVCRDTARLLATYERTNRSPLGAAAFAGTPFEVDRERTAELLGFDGLVEYSMDASSTRDFLLESVGALATLATTLSGLAEDLIVYSNRGFLELDDDYASTSSIMPQKKNPDTLELVRAVAGDALGAFGALGTTLKGLPRAYNRDLQRATSHAWDTVDDVTEATEVAAGAVATADWDETALASAAGEGFSTATSVADLLASEGVPFRHAHEVVAETAHGGTGNPGYNALDAAAREVLGESLGAYVSRQAVEKALDPTTSVTARNSRGGPAPSAVAGQLSAARKTLDKDRSAVEDAREALVTASASLDKEVDEYA